MAFAHLNYESCAELVGLGPERPRGGQDVDFCLPSNQSIKILNVTWNITPSFIVKHFFGFLMVPPLLKIPTPTCDTEDVTVPRVTLFRDTWLVDQGCGPWNLCAEGGILCTYLHLFDLTIRRIFLAWRCLCVFISPIHTSSIYTHCSLYISMRFAQMMLCWPMHLLHCLER